MPGERGVCPPVGGLILKKLLVVAAVAVCAAFIPQTALAADTGSSTQVAQTSTTGLLKLWRNRVAAARRAAVLSAHRVGVHPKTVAWEMHTTNIGHLKWLQHVWQMRNRSWVLQYRNVAPKLLCIHSFEGAWNAYSPAGYYGGLQMNSSFMRAYGWDKLVKYGWHDARYWSPADQLAVGFRAVRARGFWPWPNTAAACGLL